MYATISIPCKTKLTVFAESTWTSKSAAVESNQDQVHLVMCTWTLSTQLNKALSQISVIYCQKLLHGGIESTDLNLPYKCNLLDALLLLKHGWSCVKKETMSNSFFFFACRFVELVCKCHTIVIWKNFPTFMTILNQMSLVDSQASLQDYANVHDNVQLTTKPPSIADLVEQVKDQQPGRSLTKSFSPRVISQALTKIHQYILLEGNAEKLLESIESIEYFLDDCMQNNCAK